LTQAHISVTSPIDASNEVPEEKDHCEGYEEHEGEELKYKTLDAILLALRVTNGQNPRSVRKLSKKRKRTLICANLR